MAVNIPFYGVKINDEEIYSGFLKFSEDNKREYNKIKDSCENFITAEPCVVPIKPLGDCLKRTSSLYSERIFSEKPEKHTPTEVKIINAQIAEKARITELKEKKKEKKAEAERLAKEAEQIALAQQDVRKMMGK